MTSPAFSNGQSSMPPTTIGPTSYNRYSKFTTTPKLPPPPRRPQKRSAFSSSLAWTIRPSAVTTSAEIRLSAVYPYIRSSQPLPVPSVNPAMPVVAHGVPADAVTAALDRERQTGLAREHDRRDHVRSAHTADDEPRLAVD